ncbi:hypothetical protein PN36_17080 [Candidatus Thiomargarita nelsonii]|uniref:Uncharacterized protein n=1 Tax=Candidatus Thiomargarita nelsonii TaxID=1003181 RepID=A0A0A6P5D2_9GAMM|nr:hypothetical protein PN36_17080 [Candidatus Thiomargarita nelsonii]
MTKEQQSKTLQEVITVSSDELKAIFEDDDIVRLEYPTDEFPTAETRIIIVFSEQSGKEPQYIDLQDWLDLLEDYNESQQEVEVMPKRYKAELPEHGEEFVCIVSFRLNGDDDHVGQSVVSSEERDDCINGILEQYPNEHLDFSTEFMCKRCFQEQLTQQPNESDVSYYGSRMIH